MWQMLSVSKETFDVISTSQTAAVGMDTIDSMIFRFKIGQFPFHT